MIRVMRVSFHIPILIVLSSLFLSCGITNQTRSERSKSLPSSFFHCSFGCRSGFVRDAFSQDDDYHFEYRGRGFYNIPILRDKRIQSVVSYESLSFGGFIWRETSYLFDFRDRFFCIAFIQPFSNNDNALSRYNTIASVLEQKYGQGKAVQDGIQYGNPERRSIVLSLVPKSDNTGMICGLCYIDEAIYSTDTMTASNEL